jgi:hypothetical protein
MRLEDDMKLKNNCTPNSIYTGRPSSIGPFRKFLGHAATKSGLPPPWWNFEHQSKCESFAENGTVCERRVRIPR